MPATAAPDSNSTTPQANLGGAASSSSAVPPVPESSPPAPAGFSLQPLPEPVIKDAACRCEVVYAEDIIFIPGEECGRCWGCTNAVTSAEWSPHELRWNVLSLRKLIRTEERLKCSLQEEATIVNEIRLRRNVAVALLAPNLPALAVKRVSSFLAPGLLASTVKCDS